MSFVFHQCTECYSTHLWLCRDIYALVVEESDSAKVAVKTDNNTAFSFDEIVITNQEDFDDKSQEKETPKSNKKKSPVCLSQNKTSQIEPTTKVQRKLIQKPSVKMDESNPCTFHLSPALLFYFSHILHYISHSDG